MGTMSVKIRGRPKSFSEFGRMGNQKGTQPDVGHLTPEDRKQKHLNIYI